MNTVMTRSAATALLTLLAACATKEKAPAAAGQSMAGMSTSAPITIPKSAVFTEADVRFMQGMIAHHAQAIFMSRMAKGHGANPRVLKFANKIDQSIANS